MCLPSTALKNKNKNKTTTTTKHEVKNSKENQPNNQGT